jgi:hypothetical protein
VIAALVANPALRDVRNFLAAAWRHLRLPPPTPIQYQIVQWMAEGPDRLVVKGFRGVGKSWICSVFAAWCWAMDPDTKILVASGSARRAGDFTTFTRQLIETWDVLQDLRPGLNALRDSKLSFDVSGANIAHAPSMTSLGIGGQLTGNRADLIIADDVETESNSDTPTKREKLTAHVQEFASILSPKGRTIFLGTDQSEESLYRALEGKGYTVRVWPARYPDRALRAALGDTLAPEVGRALDEDECLVGRPLDAARFPHEELLVREAELGSSRFNLQFQLDPRMSDKDRFPIRLSDLVVMPLDAECAPERVTYGQRVQADVPCLGFSGDRYWSPVSVAERWAPYQGKILALDPAGRGRDETAAVVLGQLNGFLYLLDVRAWLGVGYTDEVLAQIAEMASRFRVSGVVVEANFGDGMVARLLEPHLHRTGHHCFVEEVKHHTQKERRILDTLEPVIQQHRLVVDSRVLIEDLRPIPGLGQAAAQLPYRLAYQLSRITRDRGSLQRDDRLDALAIAAAYWRDAMAQDAERRQKEGARSALDREIERFHECAANPLAPPPGPPGTWLSRSVGRPGPPGVRQRGPGPRARP